MEPPPRQEIGNSRRATVNAVRVAPGFVSHAHRVGMWRMLTRSRFRRQKDAPLADFNDWLGNFERLPEDFAALESLNPQCTSVRPDR